MLPKDLAIWRKAERERLIAARRAMPSAERERATKQIAARLSAELLAIEEAGRPIRTLALYWPLFGEIDLRGWAKAETAARAPERPISFALPVVTTKNAPLEFWRWRPGDAMVKGFWDIPVPAAKDPVMPDALTAPLVGFDAGCYRLGYGGGYFDRTLAELKSARPPGPLAIGIGLSFQQMATIRPEPHDIPMDLILTEAAVLHRTTS